MSNNYLNKYKHRDTLEGMMSEFMNMDSMFVGHRKMDNMMSRFFDDDDFFNGNDIMDFGSRRNRNFDDGFGGNFVSHQVVYSSHIDKNGKKVEQKYVQKQTNFKDKNGKNVGEKRVAYNNSNTGESKYLHDRYMGEKGLRLKREIKGNEQNEHKIFRGIDENELNNFKSKWEKKTKKYGTQMLSHNNKKDNKFYLN